MFPIQEHPTWNIRDSSKLDDFIACHRKFFYAHILGWRSDAPAHDLYFGECWHIAREHQLLNGYDDVPGAFQKFMAHYRLQFHESTDELYVPKTPAAVLRALMKFAEERSSDLRDNSVVEINGHKMTEISGSVPVDDKRVLHYRMDSIMCRNEDQRIFSWDHKTTSAKYIGQRSWTEQFHLSIQNGTYTHCLYCLFPIEQVLGVEFCGTGFEYLSRGSKARGPGYYADLVRVPAFKEPDQMNVWLWNTIDILNDLDREIDRMYHCHEEDNVMQAFQMNPKSCTAYRGCPYHDYCCSWANPLQHCYESPIGFKQEFWNPSEMKTTNKMNLEMPR